MVEYYQRRSASEPLEKVNRPYVSEGVWLHVPDKKVDLEELSEKYQLNCNVLRDVLDKHELPRTEFKDEIGYVFIRLPSASDNGSATKPLLAVLAKDQFFTLSPHAVFSPKNLDPFLPTSTSRPASLLASVIAGVVAEFEKRVNTLEEKIAVARHRLRRHEVQNSDFIEFVTIDDRLNEYRSSLEGVLGVTRQLHLNRHKLFKPRDLESLEDISLHIQQLLVSISASTQTISSIQNTYSTIANNTLNQRMKILTSMTILLAIPNVFYGMYGMNIALPFQEHIWAYPLITGFTLLLILLVFVIARRYRLF